ncbi:restriction endonuclease subunit M/S [Bacteroidetes/Chlorobi group bacterium Naka2016]|jgi:type I restriction enzyme M protein|nr:MAG: restriction endonuclease subunit M/S [Bacteroidetes/Chlorobi group bacterium Naka2016]
MLNQEVKNRINNARDVLVGKIPDPKAQVEQITTALIYKFMDDMDRQAIELGGNPTFFVDELQEFSWRKLLSPELSGLQRWELYTRALEAFARSPIIPSIFRTIFKDAFLPYKDSETLNLFLKVINEFSYDHSEDLGNAYEYLLSILGSQGDAGQFRTPRHIIDFIVEVVDPDKNERILDPACGTAGFLISSYKHILRKYSSNYDPQKFDLFHSQDDALDAYSVEVQKNGNFKGDRLSPDERKQLARNIVGYDISPDMVRLSLVNMYLHGFHTPQIYEYDTLTYEDRWNEIFDVILANPPFMSPKGGIRPHSRFQIQANRSEVLFVDYIAEHLTINGRAGIIVPEGIIFQSGKAYKALRKNLVENWGLFAVVSLPPGIFNPYSGVKTSILFLDRQRAKLTDEILFVKVENDGFDLGAQRRKIEKNDLPEAYRILKKWQKGEKEESPLALWVKKEKLAENGEYNLTGDRYRVVEKRKHQKWQMVELKEKTIIKKGSPITKELIKEGNIPVIAGGQTPAYYHNESNREGKTITVSASGAYAGFINYFKQPIFASDCTTIQTKNENELNSDFLYYVLKSKQDEFYKLQKGMGQPHVYAKDFENFQIPLPPLEVQKEIVAEIEGYQKIIDGCRQVIDAWKPDVETYLEEELKTYLAEHPEKKEELSEGWQMVKLGEVIETLIPPKKIPTSEYLNKGAIPIVDQSQNYIAGYTNDLSSKIDIPSPVVIFGDHTCTVKYVDFPFAQGADGIKIIKSSEQILSKYLFFYLLANPIKSDGYKRHFSKLQEFQIPLPLLEVQQRIVDKIEAERKVIDSLREMVKTYEEKIKRAIDKVWGEE